MEKDYLKPYVFHTHMQYSEWCVYHKTNCNIPQKDNVKVRIYHCFTCHIIIGVLFQFNSYNLKYSEFIL